MLKHRSINLMDSNQREGGAAHPGTNSNLHFPDDPRHKLIAIPIPIQMVYIDSWDEFIESVQLFRTYPELSRYVMKYQHCDGKSVLKVTDNRQCLKYKTDQAQDARKMEKLNNIFLYFNGSWS